MPKLPESGQFYVGEVIDLPIEEAFGVTGYKPEPPTQSGKFQVAAVDPLSGIITIKGVSNGKANER